jgi:Domain of unknown function (DUF6484)
MQHELQIGSLAEYETTENAAAKAQTPIEELLESRPTAAERNEAVVIGTLAAWGDDGQPLVDYPGNPVDNFLLARSTVPLNQCALGREVALMFVDGDSCQPLVIGVLQLAQQKMPSEVREPLSIEVDGQQVVSSADKDIVLRTGKASITLTPAGKIILRGTYLLSRSSGVNRIQGGSIELN